MTGSRAVRSTVEVPVDPATALAVFTEEIDCWWIRGAINFQDSTRAIAMHIEPGVGGRVLEPTGDLPDEEADGPVWIELRVGDAAVLVFGREEDVGPGPSSALVPWLFVDDLDAHHARGRRARRHDRPGDLAPRRSRLLRR